MGRRDIRHHETKKPKKDTKKSGVSEMLEQSPVVDVIKKKKRKEDEED
ncbi:MAG: hypothetical protein WC958_02395 [Dehalococcoidales bacterium]